jgi:serine/threonine-protein kinase
MKHYFGIISVLVVVSLFMIACGFAANATPTPNPTSTPIPTSTPLPIPTAVPSDTPAPTAVPVPTNPPPQISAKDGMTLLYIPAGDFQMGSTEVQFQAAVTACVSLGNKQADCQASFINEKPVHKVSLDAFWIDQTLVTNGKYAKCVKDGICLPPLRTDSNTQKTYYGDAQFFDYPVINVIWSQANTYCKWAGRSLPTEAQWEKAAHGADGRTYPWGEGIDPQKATYNAKDTTQVGSFPTGASPYGAADMAGNVFQWVADWYDEKYYTNSPDQNPTGPESGTLRVLRGGSWNNNEIGLRSSLRGKDDPAKGFADVGFRCAISPASK